LLQSDIEDVPTLENQEHLYKKKKENMVYLIKNEDEDFENRTWNQCISHQNYIDRELKRTRLWDKQFDEILREIGVYLVFLFFLYFVSFSNFSDSSFTYNELFESTFVQPQSTNETGLEEVCN
jgi:hypothetical protein